VVALMRRYMKASSFRMAQTRWQDATKACGAAVTRYFATAPYSSSRRGGDDRQRSPDLGQRDLRIRYTALVACNHTWMPSPSL
jgi:hypothetical protein